MDKDTLLSNLQASRAAKVEEMDKLISGAAENRSDFTAEEQAQYDAAKAEVKSLDDRIAFVGEEVRRANAATVAAATTPKVEVKSEPMTYGRGYRTDNSGKLISYFRDLALSGKGGSVEAQERLNRHAQEMAVEAPKIAADIDRRFETATNVAELRALELQRRAVDRTDATGGVFNPPTWLFSPDVIGSVARAGRTVADMCRVLPLPGGTDSINIPVITTGTTAASQTEGSALNTVSEATGTASAGVKTIGGAVEASLQHLEQSPVVLDQIWFEDLLSAYNAELDRQVINGGGSTEFTGILGTSNINSVTYSDSSATVAELYPKLADVIQKVVSNRHLWVDGLVMTPARWFWLLSQLDSSNRPLVVPAAQGPYMSLGTAETNGMSVGSILGVPVSVDANVPSTISTNQDAIIAGRFRDAVLFEGQIRTRALYETKGDSLKVVLQLWSYSAFTAARMPKAFGKVTGTGLAAPSF